MILFKMKRSILLLIFLTVMLVFTPANAEELQIEGQVSKDEIKVYKSGVTQDIHKNMDVQVLSAAFYYHPDADLSYQLLKEEGQKQYPHLLSYREIDGLYRTALADSMYETELTEWRYQGGPNPYYLNAAAEIRNNGTGAMTDLKLRFDIEVKTARPRALASTLTTDYKGMDRDARWQKWYTKTINIDVIPPGEYTVIHTDDISLCSLLQNLNGKWPVAMRVKVNAYSAMDSIKSNNYQIKNIKVIPDHFIMKTLH